MKKIVLLFLLTVFFLTITAYAEDFEQIPYKIIKAKDKIYVSNNGDVQNFTTQKSKNFYTKITDDNTIENSIYVSKSGDNTFTPGTDYEFIYNSSLIGYSNRDLKFYEFIIGQESDIIKREMNSQEIEEIFQDYKIIKLSDFSTLTNSIKIKKKRGILKLILVNDTDKDLANYIFTTNNSKINRYNLNGFVSIHKNGMIQFAPKDKSDVNNWFIILVR